MICSDYYILEDKEPVPVPVLVWAEWLGKTYDERIVKRDNYQCVSVSTVFIGLNHNYSEAGPPLIFETMVFGGEYNGYQQRYSTWAEAEAGHQEVLEMVKIPDVLDAEIIG